MTLFFFLEFFHNFFKIFLKYSNPGQVEMVPGMKFIFLFFCLSHLGLARNEVRMTFFNFLIFFTIFIEIFGNAPTRVGSKRYPK